jgi:hypothetical protein
LNAVDGEASLEFEFEDDLEEADFLPLSAEFELAQNVISIQVLGVYECASGQALKYSHNVKLATEAFFITN